MFNEPERQNYRTQGKLVKPYSDLATQTWEEEPSITLDSQSRDPEEEEEVKEGEDGRRRRTGREEGGGGG